MPARSTIRYTYEDYQAIPEDTSRRYEIVDGDLFVTPAPRVGHQIVVTTLARLLGAAVDDADAGLLVVGPVTVHLHDELVLEPDVVFVDSEHLDIVDPGGAIHGPPELVVEVLSPSNRDYDRGLKRKRYLENGVAEVWLVDVDAREVEVWRAGEAEGRTEREALTWAVGGRTLELPLEEVFRGVRS